MPLPHYLTRPAIATLVALCSVPALAASVVESRLSNFAVSYVDLDTTDAYTPVAVDWQATQIYMTARDYHDVPQGNVQPLAGLQGGSYQLSSAGGSAAWTLQPDTLFALQASASSTQVGDANARGDFVTPVIVQPHTALTLTAQVDTRIAIPWDPATLSVGSSLYALDVRATSWSTPAVEQIEYHTEAGTFQDLYSVTYRNDTDVSQQMSIHQVFTIYAFSSPIPEPSTWLMFGLGTLIATRYGRSRRQA